MFIFNPFDGGTISGSVTIEGDLTVEGDFDLGAAAAQGLFLGDDDMIEFGNTAASPDVSFGWNTTQTADGLFLGLQTAGNTLVMAENGDIAFDFAHAVQTNPTLFIHSANQSTSEWISIEHNQTSGAIDAGDTLAIGGTTATNVTVGRTGQTVTLGASTTIQGATNVVSNDGGLVVGHTVKLTTGAVNELQVLGTAAADSALTLGRFSADADEPGINFLKSRNAAIASNTIVADNDACGGITWFPDDGVDFATEAAYFGAEVDDGSPAAGDIGMAFVWEAMPGGGGGAAEQLRLTAAGDLQPGSNDNGSLGVSGTAWSDLFLAAGAVINFDASDVVVTHASPGLNLAGSAIGDGEATTGDAALSITHTVNDTTTGDGTAGDYLGFSFELTATDATAYDSVAIGSFVTAAGHEVVFEIDGAAMNLILAESGGQELIMGPNATDIIFSASTGSFDFDALLQWSTGQAITAGDYQVGRNADGTNLMQYNVPTGALHEISVNDVTVAAIDSTGISVPGSVFVDTLNPLSASTTLTIQSQSFSNTDTSLSIGTGTYTTGAGETSTILGITPVMNQSDSAGWIILSIDVDESSFQSGSGEKAYLAMGSDGNSNFQFNNDGRFEQGAQGGVSYQQAVSVTTADATVTTLRTISTEPDSAFHVTAYVCGHETTDSDETASYVIHGTFQNDGGTLTQIGSTTDAHTAEVTAAWACGFNANNTSDEIEVQVTGAAATNIQWAGHVVVVEVEAGA